jgi:hypothetical protein
MKKKVGSGFSKTPAIISPLTFFFIFGNNKKSHTRNMRPSDGLAPVEVEAEKAEPWRIPKCCRKEWLVN